ncbi:MAG: hypothetical protein NTY09_12930 [bacterium]|nr:hypothetical protein [bacterium]
MKWSNMFLVALALITLLSMGCSGNGNNPTSPGTNLNPAVDAGKTVNYASPSLMGYYDVYIDPEAGIVEAVPNRGTEFILNTVRFLNNSPAGIGLSNIILENRGDYFYIALDWSIKHPAPISPDLDVFDMRGSIIFDGTGVLGYNTDLKYGAQGIDQTMINADGYTRWFNKREFLTPGFGGYSTGNYAIDTVNCEGTFNPYKYFADGLGATDDLYPWLQANTAGNGRFTAGANLTRRMEFNFPIPAPGIKFGYSVFALWEDVGVVTNTPEAVACNVDVTDDIYFDGNTGGGSLILDAGLYGWMDAPTSIYIESTVLDSPYQLTVGEMIPTSSGTNWAIYHTEIPSDSVTSVAGQEFWVIAEYAGYNYISPFGIANDAGTDTLAAGFRYDLLVADAPLNQPPDITSGVDGAEEVYVDSIDQYTVTATDPNSDALTYAWTVTDTSDSSVVYNGPGNGAGGFDVNWDTNVGASVGEEYEIGCQVSDPTHDVMAVPLIVTVVETPNLPPVIYGGIFGADNAGETSILDYSVSASDPNDDPLIYSWKVTNIADHSVKFTGPGDGAGVLTLDWDADIGAVMGNTYSMECTVSDGVNPEVSATALSVEITNQPPELISGITGKGSVLPTDVKTYTVEVVDPEGDTITYSWDVLKLPTMTSVFSGPGDGAGGFEIDWANDIGAASGETYLVTCSFSDPTHAGLLAIPMVVLIL